METEYFAVPGAAGIPQGQCKAITVAGVRLILAHLADGFHAVEDRCTHAGVQLDPAHLFKGSQIGCPLHGARFDLRNGAAKTPPAFRPLKVFPVRLYDGQVEVSLPQRP